MNSKIIAKTTGAIVIIALLFFSLSAWNQSTQPVKKATTDTIPKPEKKFRDLDEALMELDKSKAELDQQLKSIDWQNMEKELQAAMKNLDGEKMKLQMEKALQQVDAVKMKAAVDASISKVDFEKIKQEMERVKEIDFAKIEENLKNIKPEIERSMNEAKKSMEKAKVEMTEFKSFTDGLEKDGLINKKEPYTIEIKKDGLIINGKEQPEAVYNKYRTFLEKHQNNTIKKSSDDFNIHKD